MSNLNTFCLDFFGDQYIVEIVKLKTGSNGWVEMTFRIIKGPHAKRRFQLLLHPTLLAKLAAWLNQQKRTKGVRWFSMN